MKVIIIVAVMVMYGLGVVPLVDASDAGFLYGRVVTVDDDTYTGQLRWGTEETFWDDIFNSSKTENPFTDYLDDEILRKLNRDNHDGWSFFGRGNHEAPTHAFAVRFGDLKSIHVEHDEEVLIAFRNGVELELEGGSNDVGAKITVMDSEVGEIQLKWDRVKHVEFMETPVRLEPRLGDPIYGTVETRHGAFTGLVQWDHQECLTTDELDGDTEDGDVTIEFGKIASIEKERRGSIVTLRSGREMFLTGSNDVNSENRGVIVKSEKFGKVKIGWKDFEKVEFEESARTSGRAYSDYGTTHELSGEVATDEGERYSGRIVYDLDEEWDVELLHGRKGDTEFIIPFRDVAKITPVGRRRAIVVLRNGEKLELEESQDVSRRNDGMLVFTDERKPVYVAWRDIDEIVFR